MAGYVKRSKAFLKELFHKQPIQAPLLSRDEAPADVVKTHAQQQAVLQRTRSTPLLRQLSEHVFSKRHSRKLTVDHSDMIPQEMINKDLEDLGEDPKEMLESIPTFRGNLLVMNHFFCCEIDFSDRESLMGSHFFVYCLTETFFVLKQKGMQALIDFLKDHPQITVLDFACIEENIRLSSLQFLIDQLEKSTLPDLTKLTFAKHQLKSDKKLFDQLKNLRSQGILKIYVRFESEISSLNKMISDIEFSDLSIEKPIRT